MYNNLEQVGEERLDHGVCGDGDAVDGDVAAVDVLHAVGDDVGVPLDLHQHGLRVGQRGPVSNARVSVLTHNSVQLSLQRVGRLIVVV